ncbi:hypothetical protein B0A48_06158 [Cryoendolithus antarcticus]|uniref:RRM domain-containing protein n=1 Tax=Cryoendolithus antarcticus TaxID=1507870 RepID=A0A1V8TAM9_9PEZI|nr:hypothetical protein B0A48_06158 [Cryoendolithus antarcticus]
MASVNDGTRLYDSNLLYQVQPQEVQELFVSHGLGINIDMSIDPFKHRNLSYCFVDLHTACNAELVGPHRSGLTHYDQAAYREIRSPEQATDEVFRLWSTRPHVPHTNRRATQSSTFDRWRSEDIQKSCYTATAEARRLFVGGMSRIPHSDVVDAVIRDLFKGWQVLAVSKLISSRIHWTQAVPGSRQYCLVDFVSPQEAKRAVAKCDGKPTAQGGRHKIEFAR